MLTEILKAYLIGICASVPLGPVAILVLQKSLGYGRRAGFVTGLGATIVDTMYATIAIFALAVVESFIMENKIVILIAGGLIVALLGLSMVFNDPFRKLSTDQDSGFSIKNLMQAVAMAISNPGAIAVMLTLFAFFGVKIEYHDFRIAPVVLAVSGGSVSYWFIFSWLFSRWRKNFSMSTMVWINRISGVMVMIIGIALLAEGLMKVFFM